MTVGGMVKKVLSATRGYKLFKPMLGGWQGLFICLHRVIPQTKMSRFNPYLEITPEYLDVCLRYFQDHDYLIASLDDVYAIVAEGRGDGRKFVCFTLDDGYMDNYTYAYPEFKKHNAPFSVAITTGYQDGLAVNWWYLLEELLMDVQQLSVVDGDQRMELDCSGMARKYQSYLAVLARGLSGNNYRFIDGIFEDYHFDARKRSAELILGWEQVAIMAKDPLVTMMAHTVNHYALNRLSPEEVVNEIKQSQEILESKIGKKVLYFAYPFGTREAVGKREFDIVKGLGFKMAFTTRDGFIYPLHRNHMECLPRIGLPNNEDLDFITSGAKSALKNRFKTFITE